MEGVIYARNEPEDKRKRKLKSLLEKIEMLDELYREMTLWYKEITNLFHQEKMRVKSRAASRPVIQQAPKSLV